MNDKDIKEMMAFIHLFGKAWEEIRSAGFYAGKWQGEGSEIYRKIQIMNEMFYGIDNLLGEETHPVDEEIWEEVEK